MSNALPYYPRYPRDFFEGTIGMTLEEKGAYGLVLDLIYMMGERGLPDDPHYISGQIGCSVRKWNTIRKTLISKGKLKTENGIISNLRADKVRKKQRSYQDKQAQNASTPNENRALEKPPQTYREEPEPEPVEVDKSTSTLAADFLRFWEAHPNTTAKRKTEGAFNALVEAGENPKKLIAAAKAYADHVAGFSEVGRVQQSNNFLDPQHGKWREYIPRKAAPAPDPQAILENWASHVRNGKGFGLERQTAEQLVAAGMVTSEQLQAAQGYNG